MLHPNFTRRARASVRTYTVKVPPQWTGINSDRAQVYLREFFIHPLALPPDPGAGERAARLTLNERQVDALARGTGEKPAVALRRLLAARVRELPGTVSTAIVPMREKRPQARRVPSLGESLPIPAWFCPRDPEPGRTHYWKSLGADHQRAMLQAHVKMNPELKVQPGEASPVARRKQQVAWLSLLALAILYVLMYFFGTRSQDSGAATVPVFPAWRPK
jgi:hypothetical protein